MENFNSKLRQLRLEQNRTQKEVAEALGITRTAIVNYESGSREPSLDTLRRICDFFDVSADYLIGRSEYE